MLLAEVLPLLIGDGGVDEGKGLALLVAEVGAEGGGQGVGQVTQAFGPTGRVGQGGVYGG